MALIRFLLRHSRKFLLLAVLTGITSGACNTGLLATVNAALARQMTGLRGLIIAFVALCVISPIARTFSELLMVRLVQDALLKLRNELSRQILHISLRRLEEVGTHRLMSAQTDDIPNITMTVGLIPVFCINIGVVVSCLLYMAWLNLTLLMVVLGFMLVGVLSYQAAVVRALGYLQLARKEDDEVHKHFRALLLGIKELKMHRRRREELLSSGLDGSARAARELYISGLTIYTIASSWGQLLVFLAIGLLAFLLSAKVGVNGNVLTGYTLALLYIMEPLQMIMNDIPALGRTNVAIHNIEELGLTLANYAAPEETKTLSTFQPSSFCLRMVNVSYAYRSEDSESGFVLGPIDLTVLPGELLFITGGNGSGKTTLAKLLLGLYSPDSGQILLNGLPINDEVRDTYRQHFSVVFSDFYLFETLLGLNDSEVNERAGRYLKEFNLNHKVAIKNGVLSTVNLSQGQRKRLALLTAYLEDRPIYFLDEWAADQDPVFKDVFYFQLLRELKVKGKTIIVISHDDRYYSVADRVIKLDSGRVVSEIGPCRVGVA